MAAPFEPNLSILPDEQRRLWPELRDVPQTFVLCGGTAIALQLGHRTSRDFDFVAFGTFDPDELFSRLPLLAGSEAIQKSANTLSCIVKRDAPVQLSFFGTPGLRLLNPPLIASDNHVRIASLLDLSAMKAAVVQKRAEARDYIDLDAIVQQGGVDLPTALAAARALYGPAYNPELTLKSLSFFGDGNLANLPPNVQNRLEQAVRSVNLNELPKIRRS